MALARIGLGSNRGDSRATVLRAMRALERAGRVRARSSLYRSAPWGVRDQPDFVNAAVLLETALEPRALLGELKALERRLGRVPSYRWGPRLIDLDVLAYDDVRVDEPGLVLPHPRLAERAFALIPLAEIDPAFVALRDALPAAERREVWRIRAAATRTAGVVDWDEALERVRSAADFCASAGLARFRLEEDELAVEVRRSGRVARTLVPDVSPAAHNGAHGGNGAPSPAEKPRSLLRAEFVGIVRFSRPAVIEGSSVGEGRELAYVEALGIRNPVRSGGAGRVAEVFVTDGQAVEYGQPLFAIEN